MTRRPRQRRRGERDAAPRAAPAAAQRPAGAAAPGPRLPSWAAFGLALASGSLWFLASPPFDLAGLAWVAMLPLLYAIQSAPTPGRAALYGWVAGMVTTGGGFYWLIALLRRFAGFSLPAAAGVFVLFCAYQGCISMASAWTLRRVRDHVPVPFAVLCPLVVVTFERLVPELFPCGLWISQSWHPLVLQIAELTGPLGVTALLFMVNGALYALLIGRRAALRQALVAALVVAVVLGGGALRMRQVDAAVAQAPTLAVGLVQPNAAYPIDGPIPRAAARDMLAALHEQTEQLVRDGAELVVWSEGSYPFQLPRDLAADFAAGSPYAIRPGAPVPLVVGALTVARGSEEAYNSALLVDRDGRVTGRYDKVRLLAFGEYVPAIEAFPWLRELLPAGAGRFTAGAGPATLSLTGADGATRALGPVICYEDILQGYLRRVGALHPDLLVNLTSDGWFGAATEPWQHLALSVFASIELRTTLVRAVNSGVSALVDPNGRLIAHSAARDPYRAPHPAERLLVRAPLLAGGRTVFVVVGNLFGDLCGAATGVLLVLALRRARRARR